MPETPPTKDDLLAAIAAERRYWDALVAVVEGAGLMDRPGTNNGAWTFKEMAAHLNGWRERTVARLEAASRGAFCPPSPWPADLRDDTEAGLAAINAWLLERDRLRPAPEILTETVAQFDAMGAAVAAMSADDLLTPGRFVRFGDWLRDTPLGPAVLGFSFAHLHIDHEPDIRAWLRREAGSEPALPPAPPTFGYGV